MKKLYIILLLMITAVVPAHAQIDDDLEYDEFMTATGSIGRGSSTVVNKYRLGDGLRLSSDNGYGLHLSGYVQANAFLMGYPDDGDVYARFRIRRARIRLQGNAMGDRIRYRLGIDLVKGSETDSDVGSMLQDAWVQWRPWGNNRLAIMMGQRNTPTDNRELMMSSFTLQFNERSKLSSLYGNIREIGIFAESTLRLGGKSYLRPSLALTDGDGAITAGKRYGGLKYGGRINYLPLGLFRMSGETREGDMVYELSPKLSIGVAYSYNDGVSDRRGGRDSGQILYMNDRNQIDLPDYGKFTADFLFKFRGMTLMGEFAKSWAYVPESITQRVRNDGSATADFTIDGAQNVSDYIKNRMILGSAFNIQGGYMFRSFWSVDLRYTHIMPDDYSYMNNDLYYNRNNIYELSVSKYLTRSYAAKIQATAGLIQPDGAVRGHDDRTYKGWEKTFNIMFQLAF